MRWEFGAVLPGDVKSNLCGPEQAFFSKYSKDLAAYMRSVGPSGLGGVDLMTDHHPPKGLYIEVRCLQVRTTFQKQNLSSLLNLYLLLIFVNFGIC